MKKGSNKNNKNIILFVFFILFFFNGVGFLAQNRILIVITSTLLPIILFSLKLKINKPPPFIRGLLIIYIPFSLISVIASINLFSTLINLMFIFLCASILVFGTRLQEENIRFLRTAVIVVTVLLALYSYLLAIMVNFGYIAWLPSHGYQLVYSKFGSHNHIGDLIAVILVLLLTEFSRPNLKALLFMLLLTAQFIFSYSRSAYFSFGIGVIAIVINRWQKERLKSVLLTVVMMFCFVLIIVTTREARLLPLSNNINRFFSNNLNLGDKVFLGTRVLFWGHAAKLIDRRPLLGYGAGNYEYAVNTIAHNEKLTADTSHNIIIDIAVEQGLPAALVFCAFLIYCFKKASKKSPYFIAVLVMLTNFLLDYTFRIPGMLLLFFLFLGISIRESHSS